MREYVFDELGFFSPDTCERIKAAMDNRTYMDFRVSWSNHAGNCTLMICTDFEVTEEQINSFFLYAALTELGR